ncbi:MAG TPA: hypothetical protein PKC55_07535 [Dysgonomonas sp.]|uniref:hypothetical protein n=1 Tax=unclassified Dysgonomonas TaxID=2630389 RepID=UPI0025BBB813|nr:MULTISPECIES: hypothetical protein [unclassified Dysgonomonas]HML64664.1 hypothetical protein [Dysgonomonas sp.]
MGEKDQLSWGDLIITLNGKEIQGIRDIKYNSKKQRKMIHHSTKNITISIDKLIDTIVVVGDNVDTQAIENKVLKALHNACEKAVLPEHNAVVNTWAQPERPIKRKMTLDDFRAAAKHFEAMSLPPSCYPFLRASIDVAKDREERIATARKSFELWCFYYFPRWCTRRPFINDDL